MTRLEVGAACAALLLVSVPLLTALSGPVGSFANPVAACGSAYIDGGVNPATDAGHLDGGYEVDSVTAESMASIKIENNSTTPVYLGGSTVQPGTGVLAICTDTATCASAAISIDTRSGALFCTATAATTVRTLSGGY